MVKQEYGEGARRLTALDARGCSCTELPLPSLSQVGGRRKNMRWWSCGPSHPTPYTAGQTAAQASQEASAVITMDPAESLTEAEPWINTLTLTHGRLLSHGLVCEWICSYRQIVLFFLCSVFASGDTLLWRTLLGGKTWLIHSNLQKFTEIKPCFHRAVSCYNPTEFHFLSIFEERDF